MGTKRLPVSISSVKGHATHSSSSNGALVVSKTTRLRFPKVLEDLHLETKRSLVSISSVTGHPTHGSCSNGASVVSKTTSLRVPSALKPLHLRTTRSLVSISSVKGHATRGSVSMCVSVVSKTTRPRFPSALKDLHRGGHKIASVYLERKWSRNSRQCFDVRVGCFKSDETSISKFSKASPFPEAKCRQCLSRS